jgi:hypothetical protein
LAGCRAGQAALPASFAPGRIRRRWTPAPDLPALALKIDLIAADQTWELSGAEECVSRLSADARRLAENGDSIHFLSRRSDLG